MTICLWERCAGTQLPWQLPNHLSVTGNKLCYISCLRSHQNVIYDVYASSMERPHGAHARSAHQLNIKAVLSKVSQRIHVNYSAFRCLTAKSKGSLQHHRFISWVGNMVWRKDFIIDIFRSVYWFVKFYKPEWFSKSVVLSSFCSEASKHY